MTQYLTVRGTGEEWNSPDNMLNAVAELVDAEHIDIKYPASIACFNSTTNVTGVSELESRRQGVANLAAAIRATDELVVISGYSLGALVVSDFLARKRAGEFGDCEVAAVVNIANPARQAGVSYGLPSNGFGLDGQHKPWPDIPVYEIANPSDLITSAPANSPWRMLADKIRVCSASDPIAWMADLTAQLSGQEAQQAQANLFNLDWWQAYAEAPGWAYGYLFGGEHFTHYGDLKWYAEDGSRVSGIELAAKAVSKHL